MTRRFLYSFLVFALLLGGLPFGGAADSGLIEMNPYDGRLYVFDELTVNAKNADNIYIHLWAEKISNVKEAIAKADAPTHVFSLSAERMMEYNVFHDMVNYVMGTYSLLITPDLFDVLLKGQKVDRWGSAVDDGSYEWEVGDEITFMIAPMKDGVIYPEYNYMADGYKVNDILFNFQLLLGEMGLYTEEIIASYPLYGDYHIEGHVGKNQPYDYDSLQLEVFGETLKTTYDKQGNPVFQWERFPFYSFDSHLGALEVFPDGRIDISLEGFGKLLPQDILVRLYSEGLPVAQSIIRVRFDITINHTEMEFEYVPYSYPYEFFGTVAGLREVPVDKDEQGNPFKVHLLGDDGHDYFRGTELDDGTFLVTVDRWRKPNELLQLVIHGKAHAYGTVKPGEGDLPQPVGDAITYTLNKASYEMAGKTVQMEAAPYLRGDHTLIPVRALDSMGAQFAWDDKTKTATFKLNNQTVKVTIGQTTAYVNGVAKIMPVAAEIDSGRTMVPFRFVAENLNLNVHYKHETREIVLSF